VSDYAPYLVGPGVGVVGWLTVKAACAERLAPFSVHCAITTPVGAAICCWNGNTANPSGPAVCGPPAKLFGWLLLLYSTEDVHTALGKV